MRALANAGICLNVCPTSNLKLGRVERLQDHPIRALFVSQLIVFVVFPLFRRGVRWLPLVAVASGLAVWGFYTLVSGSAST